MLQSITECYRVLQSITKCYRVLQSFTEFYRVLQSITEYYRVIQSITEYYRVLQSITEYYRDKSSASTWTNFWACSIRISPKFILGASVTFFEKSASDWIFQQLVLTGSFHYKLFTTCVLRFFFIDAFVGDPN